MHVATPKSANLAEPSLVVKIFGPMEKKEKIKYSIYLINIIL